MSQPPAVDAAPDPEEDAAIARSEFAAEHLEHAAFHIAGALGEDPNRANWLETFDAIIAASPNPLGLVGFDPSGSSYSIGAAQAYILAKAGRHADAFGLLFQVIAARPDVAYMDWGIRWMLQPEIRAELKSESVSRFLGWLSDRLPALMEAGSKEQPTLIRLFPFAQALMVMPTPNAMLLSMCASLLCRAGQIQEALVIAHIDSGWAGSARRKALLAIARGPMDWSISAAALALALVAHDQREAEPEISQLFNELLSVRPTPGDVCYAHTVVACLLRLPGLTPSERQRAIQWQRELSSSATP